MREIVIDTETTGLDPFTGDRIVEIGGVELENHIPTGRTYHQYINPERDMPQSDVVLIIVVTLAVAKEISAQSMTVIRLPNSVASLSARGLVRLASKISGVPLARRE